MKVRRIKGGGDIPRARFGTDWKPEDGYAARLPLVAFLETLKLGDPDLDREQDRGRDVVL